MKRDPLIVSLKEETAQEINIPAPMPRPPRRRRHNWVPIIVLVCIAIIGASIYVYRKSDKTEFKRAETPEEAQEQSLSIIEKVGTHIVLPEGEEPTIATVSDPSKLNEQTFFANAKVGDVVLIYGKARKAYLYDPAIDKLLEVAPIAQ
jgi:hypothetical protein